MAACMKTIVVEPSVSAELKNFLPRFDYSSVKSIFYRVSIFPLYLGNGPARPGPARHRAGPARCLTGRGGPSWPAGLTSGPGTGPWAFLRTRRARQAGPAHSPLNNNISINTDLKAYFKHIHHSLHRYKEHIQIHMTDVENRFRY